MRSCKTTTSTTLTTTLRLVVDHDRFHPYKRPQSGSERIYYTKKRPPRPSQRSPARAPGWAPLRRISLHTAAGPPFHEPRCVAAPSSEATCVSKSCKRRLCRSEVRASEGQTGAPNVIRTLWATGTSSNRRPQLPARAAATESSGREPTKCRWGSWIFARWAPSADDGNWLTHPAGDELRSTGAQFSWGVGPTVGSRTSTGTAKPVHLGWLISPQLKMARNRGPRKWGVARRATAGATERHGPPVLRAL